MQYHIEFNICGAICLVIYYIFLRFSNKTPNRRNIQFRFLVLTILCADVLDAVTAATISYSEQVPVAVNIVLNTLYYVFAGASGYMFIRYMRYVLVGENRKLLQDRVNDIIWWCWVALCLTNPLHKLIFSFDAQKNYVHGALFSLVFVITFYYIFFVGIQVFFNYSKLTKRQLVSVLSFILCVFCGAVLQMFMVQGYLVIYFSLSLAVTILIFNFETPDYNELLSTLVELENITKEAEEAKKAADAANMAKSAFLANMSHEIRTPINGILGMNAIALEDEDSPEQKERLQNIKRSGESLLGLVEGILDFTQIESGKMEIKSGDYRLENVLTSVKNMVAARAEEKELTFEIANDGQIPTVMYGDEVHIRQIMVNLLNNAIKYTLKGGIGLRVDMEKGTTEQEITLVIRVRDTGIGISKENQNNLFQAFERIDLTTNRSVEGIGLGLTITRQLTELMGGQITFDSTYGKGSEFTIRIPQKVVDKTPMGAFGQAKADSELASDKPFIAPDKSILVVDDVPMNLKVVKGLLRDTKINVVMAGSGMECLSLAEKYKYDLILMDHMMPEMDGVETLHQLRSDDKCLNQETPVIVLTANAIAGVRDEYLQYGFDEYLPKPVDKPTLVGTLKRFIATT